MKQRIPDLVLPKIMSNGKSSSPNLESLTAVLKAWQRRLSYFSIFAALPAVIGSQLQEAKGDELKPPAVPVSGAANKARRLRNPNNSSSTPAFLRRQGSYLLPHQKGEFNIAAAQLTGSDNCPGTAIPAGVYTAAAPFTNTGNTAGANNTVISLRGYYYYYTYNFGGPDLVYAFTVTALGPAPKIRITPTSTDYAPAVYILYGGNGGGCPAGIENTVGNDYAAAWGSPGNPVELNAGYLPLDVPLHLFVDSYGSVPATSGPYTLRIEDMTVV